MLLLVPVCLYEKSGKNLLFIKKCDIIFTAHETKGIDDVSSFLDK